jgi:hypothetical protein
LDDATSETKVAAFLNAGVTCFLDLTDPTELKPYADIVERLADTTVKRERFPIRDQSVPDAPSQTRRLLDTIDQEIERGGLVYLHCYGGVGRTGTIVGCWLSRQGSTVSEGLQSLWSECPKSHTRQSPETREQEEYIRNWNKYDDPAAGLRTWRALSGTYRSQFRGTMLGLAIGDALGSHRGLNCLADGRF